MGAKKKESTNSDALCACVDDCVSVENHGKHWIHLGHIISIDKNTKTAVVEWEETLKKDNVHLGVLDMYYIQSHSQQRYRGGLGILIPSLFSFEFLQFQK